MKRTDKLTNFIAILLFAALVIYAGAYAIRALRDTTVTATAVEAEVRPGGVASGIVIREETVLTSGERYIDITARDGTRVAAGAELATAMRSEAGLERAKQIRLLEQEIARITTALDALDPAEELTGRDTALRTAIGAITAAVARHEPGSLEGDTLRLRSLLFPGSAAGDTKEALRALQWELDTLRNGADEDTRTLTAERSGVFSASVDGYESLSPADLSGLTPARLTALTEQTPSVPSGAYGKLVSSFRWYFAAVMDESDAENLTPGRSATLNFGRYYGADILARVESIGIPEGGSVVVVFRCNTALADTLAMRRVTADVVFEQYTGIRIPSPALRTDAETGADYVWCITAMQLERKDVTVLYRDGDFAVVEGNVSPDALRPGNTVVVSGDDLYEGKFME